MSLVSYIKETKGELKHVSWPTRAQTTEYTAVVIGISVLVAVYLGVFDFIFTEAIKILIS